MNKRRTRELARKETEKNYPCQHNKINTSSHHVAPYDLREVFCFYIVTERDGEENISAGAAPCENTISLRCAIRLKL